MGQQKKDTSSTSVTDTGRAQDGAALMVLAVPFVLAGVSVWTLWKLAALPALGVGLYLLGAGVCYVAAGQRLGARVWLVISMILAALITPLVFLSHSFPFKAMVAAVAVSFALALVSGLWSALRVWLKLLAALMAASLTAVLIVPPPPGSFDPSDDEPIEVILGVYDENVQPLPEAYALCTLASEQAGRFVLGTDGYQKTDEYGEATFTFEPRTHWNAIVCGAHKPASEDEDGYALVMSAGPGEGSRAHQRRHVVLTERIPRRGGPA